MQLIKIDKATLVFDDKEKQILNTTGIPPAFAYFLKEKSKELGIAFALRAISPLQRYLMPAAPKPLSIKLKTGNWSFTKGVIAVDEKLGKIEFKEGKWQLIKRDKHDLPRTQGIVEPVVHRLSLQEVLRDLNSNEFELLSEKKAINKTGHLILKPKTKFPESSTEIFRINFKEKKSRLTKQCPIDFKKILISTPKSEPRPDWWNDQWGHYMDCVDYYYPAQYKAQNDPEFKDILVYGVKDENGHVLPITGDQDLLWISVPANQHESLFKEFEEIIDTTRSGGIEELYKARLALHLRLGGTLENAEKNISNSSISGVGQVTAFESYIIDMINKLFFHCGVRHLRNLIQHAAENHSTGKLSSMDTKMVHVWHGKMSMTYNENEIVKFFMQANFPNENIININPKWDMVKWAVVINMQIALNQPINPATLNSYRKFCKENIFFSLPYLIHHKKEL